MEKSSEEFLDPLVFKFLFFSFLYQTPTVRPDKELASEAAVVNGESFILKLFQALHRSTVACPTCGECSSSFDPYLCLSLPLPQGYQRVVYVMVVSLEDCHMREVKRAFVLNQYAEILELRELVAADTNIPSKQVSNVDVGMFWLETKIRCSG